MTTLAVLFAILHIFSIAFALVSLKLLYGYIQRYQFDESKYTLLLGFIHLRWLAAGYIVAAVAWIFFSYFIFTYY